MNRFLADENIPKQVVDLLRLNRIDVSFILEDFPGETDSFVIAQAVAQKRVILTSDVELAAVTLRLGTRHFGTILLRMGALKPAEVAHLVLKELQSKTDWSSRHSILAPGKVRSRLLAQLDLF